MKTECGSLQNNIPEVKEYFGECTEWHMVRERLSV